MLVYLKVSLGLLSLALLVGSCSGPYASNGEVATEDSLHIDTVAILDEVIDLVITEDNVAEVLSDRLKSGDMELLEKSLEDVKLQLIDIKQAGEKDKYVSYILKVQQYLSEHSAELEELSPEGFPAAKEIMEMYRIPTPKQEEVIQPLVVDTLSDIKTEGFQF